MHCQRCWRRKSDCQAVIPGCRCCLGNVCQHHAEAQAAAAGSGRRRRCLSSSLLGSMLASQRCLCHKQERSQGVVCVAFSPPAQTTTTTTTKIPSLLCSSEIFLVFWSGCCFFSFIFFLFAAVRFQADPRVCSLDLRGVARGGIPPQTQQFAISLADPAEHITSGQKHFVAGAQQPIPFTGMVPSTACC